MENFKNSPFVKKVGFNRIVLCGVLLVMYIAFAIISPTFLSYSRILSALNYAYFLGFLALGVTFVIATGGIDFSIGPVMFCAALDRRKTSDKRRYTYRSSSSGMHSGRPCVWYLEWIPGSLHGTSVIYLFHGFHDAGKGNRFCIYTDTDHQLATVK